MTGRLAGKVALITGTASGQGRAAALLFAAEGATVASTDVNADGAAETVVLVGSTAGLTGSLTNTRIAHTPARAGWWR